LPKDKKVSVLRHAQKIETCKVGDELSRLYLKKDKKINFGVSGMLSFVTDSDVSINNCVDDYGIANTFGKHFSSVYFHYYMDDSEFTRCLQRLQSSISANDCQYDNLMCLTLSVVLVLLSLVGLLGLMA